MTQVTPADRRNAPPWLRLIGAIVLLGLLVACSPSLDWRQMRPEGWGLSLDMPCRPASQTRAVPLAGSPVELTLLVCHVGEHTFAVASADLADPARVGPALSALGQAALANVQGRIDREQAANVKGMTPHAAARHWWLTGRLPNGQVVVEQVLVFAHGPRVFQMTLIGPSVDERLAQPFFAALEVLR